MVKQYVVTQYPLSQLHICIDLRIARAAAVGVVTEVGQDVPVPDVPFKLRKMRCLKVVQTVQMCWAQARLELAATGQAVCLVLAQDCSKAIPTNMRNIN